MKKVFQFGIYPAIMLSASAIILYGIRSGYNQYLVTIPVITLTGILILVLEQYNSINFSLLVVSNLFIFVLEQYKKNNLSFFVISN